MSSSVSGLSLVPPTPSICEQEVTPRGRPQRCVHVPRVELLLCRRMAEVGEDRSGASGSPSAVASTSAFDPSPGSDRWRAPFGVVALVVTGIIRAESGRRVLRVVRRRAVRHEAQPIGVVVRVEQFGQPRRPVGRPVERDRGCPAPAESRDRRRASLRQPRANRPCRPFPPRRNRRIHCIAVVDASWSSLTGPSAHPESPEIDRVRSGRQQVGNRAHP